MRNKPVSSGPGWLARGVTFLATVAALGAVAMATGILPAVSFAREEIDVTVLPDRLIVAGTYHYRNPLPIPLVQAMWLPFPEGPQSPEPYDVEVGLLSPEARNVTVNRIFGRNYLRIAVPPQSEAVLVVRYAQWAPGSAGKYILRTTRSWRKPLEHGLYRLFPRGVKILDSSYPLKGNGPGGYFFARTCFMPDADWILTWEATHES